MVPQYRRLSTQAEGDALAAPSWAIGRARSTDEQAGTLDKLMARGEQFVLFCKLTMLERNEVIDFQAGEFVLGAAHARRHVYELVSTGDYSDLSDTLSASAINTLRDVAMQNPERFLDPMLTNTRLLFADATCVAEPLDTSPTGQQVHTLGMKVQFLKQDAAMRGEYTSNPHHKLIPRDMSDRLPVLDCRRGFRRRQQRAERARDRIGVELRAPGGAERAGGCGRANVERERGRGLAGHRRANLPRAPIN